MKHEAMTPTQRADREAFKATLERAGWDASNSMNTRFESGGFAAYEAVLTCERPPGSVLVQYTASTGDVLVRYHVPGRTLCVSVLHDGGSRALTDALLALPAVLDADTLRGHLRRLMRERSLQLHVNLNDSFRVLTPDLLRALRSPD